MVCSYMHNLCSVRTCIKPLLSNGVYLGDHEGPIYQYDESVQAVCTPGYTLYGPITRKCLSNGNWTEEEESSCELGSYC